VNPVPTISEVQQLIDALPRSSGDCAPDPPKVVETLLCYGQEDGFELYVVVEGKGGNLVTLDSSLTATTVSKNTPFVGTLLNAWIGETMQAGSDLLLVAACSGMEFPPEGRCIDAMENCARIGAFGAKLRASVSELSGKLRGHEESVVADITHFTEFSELHEGLRGADWHLVELMVVEGRLDALAHHPWQRNVASLLEDIAYETSELAAVVHNSEECIAEIGETLSLWRERYDALYTEQNRVVAACEAERNRVNMAYIDALRAPAPIDSSDAEREFDEVQMLLEMIPEERRTLIMRLRTLKHRCRNPKSSGGKRNIPSEIDRILALDQKIRAEMLAAADGRPT
jgi:hypothetical protein